MNIITVAIKRHGKDVESLAYDQDGVAIICKNGLGENYHLGQISSSESWARHDMQKHFKQEFDAIYPNGWVLNFEYA